MFVDKFFLADQFIWESLIFITLKLFLIFLLKKRKMVLLILTLMWTYVDNWLWKVAQFIWFVAILVFEISR